MTAGIRTPEQSQVALRLLRPLTRVATMAELFGKGYRWDGACECGTNDWDTSEWEGGWRGVCRGCGRWVCYHEAGSVAHTSEGRWAPYPNNRRARPPAGCPSLTEEAAQAPEGGQTATNQREAGAAEATSFAAARVSGLGAR